MKTVDIKYKLIRLLRAFSKNILVKTSYIIAGSFIGALTVYIILLNSRPDLDIWHTVYLDEEFSVKKQSEIVSFSDYQILEERVFKQLQKEVYSKTSKQPRNQLNRFQTGSLSDPTSYPKNWNRSFILTPEHPRGGVLLLHGLSDSPYSLRTLAKTFYQQGYIVLGLRMPGHGTAPSGLVYASWQDMAAAVKIAARHVSSLLMSSAEKLPFYIVGYSMGAAQAVNYSLDALQDKNLASADALVLISPAIGVSGVAALAVWQSRLGYIPGWKKLAWNSINPEYDPYKYNSFAVNAGDQIYRLTKAIDRKLSVLNTSQGTTQFPRTLALLSLIDATVSTQAVVTHLFDPLDNSGNKLVLFDVNRQKPLTLFMKTDPIISFRSLLQRSHLGFELSLFTNVSSQSDAVVIHRWSRSKRQLDIISTDASWPEHVYSLSHTALPFPPSDSLYGSSPDNDNSLHIGQLESKGERGLLTISANDMLRLRYNPFYSSMQQQITDFLKK